MPGAIPSYFMNPQSFMGPSSSSPDEETPEQKRKRLLYGQAESAGGFADQSQAGYGALGQEAQSSRDALRRIASGQESVSAEQLRQGLQQNIAGQRSLAQGGQPQNAAMAARNAAMNASRMGSGLAGQQAIAGLQERQNAQKALSDSIIGARGQDLQGALGSRQNAMGGYSAGNAGQPDKTWWDQYGPALTGGVNGAVKIFSDRRLKKDIEVGDDEANAAVKGLRAFTYKYKNQKFGAGGQLGIMAQDLEKAGLGQAVLETPEGKAVDVGKLSGANTAMISALGRRLAKLEGGR